MITAIGTARVRAIAMKGCVLSIHLLGDHKISHP
ncbi:hypothetical protein X758_27360 [Mesorhizobium sp. LSHC416B00]|nr:hypothetical protein X758_27360 [Mesorhizobium sp. LSHC416B00]